MKLNIKYDGGYNGDTDWFIRCMIEYFMADAEFIGGGYNRETGWRDMKYEVKLPKKTGSVKQQLFDNGMFTVNYLGENEYEIHFQSKDMTEGWSTYMNKSELVKWLEAAK